MFGPNMVQNGLTLTRVLGGISRTLSIANQIIPIYEQAKPMIGNARKMMNVLREFTASNNETPKPKQTIDVTPEKKNTTNSILSNSPQFFQ